MVISSLEILNRLESIASLDVRNSSGELAFVADRDRIRELCESGYVCGSARGQKIRYLELLVPLDEVARERHLERAHSSGCVGEDSRTSKRGLDLLANTYSHDFRICGAYGGTADAYHTCGDGVGR